MFVMPVVTVLLRHGADVNIADQDGQTPLHVAALRGHADAVMALLSHGAHATPINTTGATPLTVAVKLGHAAIAALLPAEHPAGAVGTPALVAAAAGRPALLDVPQVRASLTDTDEVGNTVLHTAGRRADRRMVVAALRAGATPLVNARDERGETPIGSVVGWMERAIADARLFGWTRADGRADGGVGAVAAGHRFRVDRTAGDRAAVGARMAGRLDEARASVVALLHAGARAAGLSVPGAHLVSRIVGSTAGLGVRQAVRFRLGRRIRGRIEGGAAEEEPAAAGALAARQ